ncbi:hypothetical protein GSI_11700 [Ganoderma sinense ZZ0214-1]|uniref:Reverse transcriptase domain-containing protein n=1 Tax=Ganoderma sinense ZZ0214-1 TaxID=1077348 RepID=A0A2G8RWQ1_9APHY|nr:hypothetical protein GSI_11700 [Ganoderma sinense ZZ0214-1]
MHLPLSLPSLTQPPLPQLHPSTLDSPTHISSPPVPRLQLGQTQTPAPTRLTSALQLSPLFTHFGAALGHTGPSHSQECCNLSTALEHPDTVAADIDTLCSRHRMHGPFAAPPLTPFRSSPLGVVSCPRNPAKLRVINHLSWPQGTSINDGIPDSESSITYESFDSAVAEICRLGRGALLAKLDLKDAFRHIPVWQADWHLLGCTWAGQLYYSVVLVFGAKSAPYIFNLFAEGLHWIIQRHIPASLRHYLDDFLPIFPPSTAPPLAQTAVEWTMALGEELGLEFQGNKTIFPMTCLDFLGLDLDTDAMEARMPADKLRWLGELLSAWEDKRTCRLRELQALIGFLQFAAHVVPHARAFIRRLIEFSMTFPSPLSNGIRLIAPTRPTVHVFTDASSLERKGIGGVFGSMWFASRVPHRFHKRDIQFKELFAVIQAVLCWGYQWSGCHVVFHIDNPASKTDPFRKGVSVVIAAAPGSVTCPVSALRGIIRATPSDETSPLFEGLETNSALTRDLFISRLKALLSAHGFDSGKYSGHSFRRGAASSAAAAGYADHEIQLLRRWRSNAYKLYIDVPQDRVLHMSNRLHWVEAEPHA